MSKKNVLLLCLGTFFLGAAAVGAYIWQPWTPSVPVFAFNQQVAPDWWSGDNTNAQETWNEAEYKGDMPFNELPVASMNVVHGSAGTSAADNCFVMYSYHDFLPENVTNEYQKYEDRKQAFDDDMALDKLGSTQQNITTFEGDVSYELRQYKLTGASVESSLQGYAIGFAKLSEGYIRIEGVCKTSDDLAKITEALQSVQLHRG